MEGFGKKEERENTPQIHSIIWKKAKQGSLIISLVNLLIIFSQVINRTWFLIYLIIFSIFNMYKWPPDS